MRIALLFLLFSTIVTAQVFERDTVTELEIKEAGAYISSSIDNFPVEQFGRTNQKAFLVTEGNGGKYTVHIFFEIKEGLYYNECYLNVTDEEQMGCTDPSVVFEDNRLKADCHFMKGAMFLTKFIVSNRQLVFETAYISDLNDGAYTAAEQAQKNDDPVAYCIAYSETQYYMDIEYRVAESLEWGHEKALLLYKKKAYQQAADIMYGIEQNCLFATEIAEIVGDDFVKIWSDATLFYLKAGMNEECVVLSKEILKQFPNETNIYLQYGDALFNLDKKEEAKEVYEKYITLRKAAATINKIPSRVLDRTK